MFNGGNRKRASAARCTKQVSPSASKETFSDGERLSESSLVARVKSNRSNDVDDLSTASNAKRSDRNSSGAPHKRRSSRATSGGGNGGGSKGSKRYAMDLVGPHRQESYSSSFMSDQQGATPGGTAGGLGGAVSGAGGSHELMGPSPLALGFGTPAAIGGGGVNAFGAANNAEEEVRAEYVRASLERFFANALQLQMYRTQTQTQLQMQTLSQIMTSQTDATPAAAVASPHFPMHLPPLATPQSPSAATPTDCQPLANAVGLLANYNCAYALLDGARVLKASRSTTSQVTPYSIESLINIATASFH